MEEKTLGILGGVGPLATAYFMEMIIKMTDADRDQDHLSMIVTNHPSIPDRTDYIFDKSKPNPLPVMIEDAKKLEKVGSDFIVIPCNTAHFFYDEIQKSVGIPVLNIIEETVKYAKDNLNDVRKIGVLGTKGTLASGSYKKVCDEYNVEYAQPDEDGQNRLMEIIYGQIKAGKTPDFDGFMQIVENMKKMKCDVVILGCTELSVIKHDFNINRADIIDSMEVLAQSAILKCDKKLKCE